MCDDIALNSTYYANFTAFRVDTGAPADVASIAVEAYPNDSATQITAGITVTNPDGIDGAYNIAVAATVANGYAAGTKYCLRISVGTVNSVSVVGAVVGEFKIRVGTPGLLHTGILQSVASAGEVRLATTASATADFFNGATLVIVGGTGAGQAPRQIYDYDTDRDAFVSPNFIVTPDNTSVVEIYATPPSATAAGALPEVTVAAGGIVAASIAAASLPASKFDAANPVPANAVQIGGQTAQAAGTVIFPTGTLSSDVSGTSSIGSGGITAASFATDALSADALSAAAAAKVMTQAMTESYAADGAAPTPAQALYLIQQMLGEFSVSSVTMTVKKLDGSTSAATFTLNDATNPTSITRAT